MKKLQVLPKSCFVYGNWLDGYVMKYAEKSCYSDKLLGFHTECIVYSKQKGTFTGDFFTIFTETFAKNGEPIKFREDADPLFESIVLGNEPLVTAVLKDDKYEISTKLPSKLTSNDLLISFPGSVKSASIDAMSITTTDGHKYRCLLARVSHVIKKSYVKAPCLDMLFHGDSVVLDGIAVDCREPEVSDSRPS